MSLVHLRRSLPPDTDATQPVDDVIWVHAAFCGMALPMRASRGAWQRNADAGSVRIEPGVSDDLAPSGRVLRLSMMHICDAAFRAKNQVVDLGGDETLLAAALGIDPKPCDLADQWQRLQAAQIVLSRDGKSKVSVFDARSRRRSGDLGWRSGVRLSAKFVSDLVDHVVVPLDRRIVRELSATPAALDAYAWIRLSLRHPAVDEIVTTTWDDLLTRFGTASQDVAKFRVSFEAALRHVFDADRSIALAVDSEGVSVRQAELADDEIAAKSTKQMQPDADVGDVGAGKQLEKLAAPPSVMPLVPVAEVAMPALLRQRQEASQQKAKEDQANAAPAAADRIKQDNISVPGHLTGLAQVIWLRRGHGAEKVLVGVTPGLRFDAERLTVLAVEPMVIQVSGGLNEKDYERVSAWVMTNRDVIDEFWEGQITSFAEIYRRVRKAPAPGWR